MTDKTSLGDRMKAYEASYDPVIIKRIPVIIRCDGKGFSKWTKKMKLDKPFDDTMSTAMSQAMLKTAEKIEGCVFGYTQSDEITFVVVNDQSLESQPWFGNRVQKMCSVVSSMVTAHFNAHVSPNIAYFDTRVFAVPSHIEAANALVWRQNDATKNSISSATHYEVGAVVGQKTANKMMHGLNQKQQQELLFKEANINWNDYPTKYKRGIACYKHKVTINDQDGNEVERSSWKLDQEPPIFARDIEFILEKISSTEE